MDIIGRKTISLLGAALLLLLNAQSASADSWKNRIKALAASNVHIVSVKAEARHLVIRGTAENNNDVSIFMRRLADNVGAPSLKIRTQANAASEFTMKVKKPKS